MKKLLATSLVLFASKLALADGGGPWGLPEPASTVAGDMDWMYGFINWVCIFFFVLIMGLMGYFMWKYRGKPGGLPPESSSHNTPLELTWSIIPLGLVVMIFYWGFQGYMHIMVPPSDAYEIQVSGQKWSWQFTYPNGYFDKDLHAPVGQKVRLVMTSQDVIHSLYIPAFRIKHDVLPGRFTKLWFQSDKPGDYQIFCTEYCGDGHSTMMARAIIHAPGEFEKWLTVASDPFKDPKTGELRPLELVGKEYFNKSGCTQCHNVDGLNGIGPTLKGIWGTQAELADGSSVLVDENYVRQSILMPQSQIVKGYQPVMPTFSGRLKDKEVLAIAKYIESLK
jgi:cytochrome c oxidase subunit 2